eukprot:gene24175-9764_t
MRVYVGSLGFMIAALEGAIMNVEDGCEPMLQTIRAIVSEAAILKLAANILLNASVNDCHCRCTHAGTSESGDGELLPPPDGDGLDALAWTKLRLLKASENNDGALARVGRYFRGCSTLYDDAPCLLRTRGHRMTPQWLEASGIIVSARN